MAIKAGNTRITVTVTPEELADLDVLRTDWGYSSTGRAARRCIREHAAIEGALDFMAGELCASCLRVNDWKLVRNVLELKEYEDLTEKEAMRTALDDWPRVAKRAIRAKLSGPLYGGAYKRWCGSNGLETGL